MSIRYISSFALFLLGAFLALATNTLLLSLLATIIGFIGGSLFNRTFLNAELTFLRTEVKEKDNQIEKLQNTIATYRKNTHPGIARRFAARSDN